ncbi:MAG: hypothetical protein EG825_10310 [Rhodocyclaceae bacterium]|nr:hypothetical protein [Rhodocyclaceae bacterium]
MSANEATIIPIVGASGSGKSWRIKQRLAKDKPRRLVVWDWKSEYDGGQVVTCPAALAAAMRKAGKGGAARLIYRPVKSSDAEIERQFSAVCALVSAWGNCWFIVEELSNVTRASYAPIKWRNICTEGRHSALVVIATTQSPALCDKTFLTNATIVYCGSLGWPSHRKVMANCMDVKEAQITELAPLQWLCRGRGQAAFRDDLKVPKKRVV